MYVCRLESWAIELKQFSKLMSSKLPFYLALKAIDFPRFVVSLNIPEPWKVMNLRVLISPKELKKSFERAGFRLARLDRSRISRLAEILSIL